MDSEESVAYEDFIDKQPKKLLEAYEEIIDTDGVIKNRAEYKAIMAKFADELHLMSREVFAAIMDEEISSITKRLDELEKIAKTHRHKTFGDGYSEKPAW